jgi:hypothetical protein
MNDLDCQAVARAALGEPARTCGSELLYRCPGPAHQHGDRQPSLSINPGKRCWYCFTCAVGGNAWALAAFLSGHSVDDKLNLAAWLRRYGLLPDALRPVPPAEISRRKRDRERLARAAARLEAEERALRISCASECRALEGLRERTVQRLRDVQGSAAAARCEELLVLLR